MGQAGHVAFDRNHAADGDSGKRALRLRRPDIVPRDRLLGAFTAAAQDAPLLLLVAPSGYGKTTAVRQWATRNRRPVAYVELTYADNDPHRLLEHISQALSRIRPAGTVPTGEGPDAPFGEALPRLLAVATAAEPALVLVLDGMQALRGSLGPDLAAAVLDSLAPGSHVVAISREQPGLRLGVLRSQGRCAEFGQAELAFSRDEVRAVLSSTGLQPTERTVEELLSRTEGWPAGVYLTALAMCNRVRPAPAEDPVGGNQQFVFEYLRDEVLRHESVDTARFLLCTAPLTRLSGALCDSVLGSADAAVRLADAARRHLFIEPVDPDQTWYRHHPLFREMLLSELRRWRPWEEAVVHRQAATWYEEQGQPDDAIGHAFAARDPENAVRLATRHGPRYINTGQARVVRGWLERLDENVPAARPALAIVAGWAWAMTGDAGRAQEYLHAAERACEPGDPAGDPPEAGGIHNVMGRVARLRAALSPFGIEQMLVDARTATGCDSPGDRFYPLSAMLLGSAALLNGDTTTARGVLERAAHFGRQEHRSMAAFALAQLSLLAADEEDWAVAGPCAAEALDLVADVALDGWPLATTIHLANARVAVHRKEHSQARQITGDALRQYFEAPPVAFPWLAAQTAIALGQALLAVDEYAAAISRLAEARRRLAHLQTQGTLAERAERLARDIARYGDQPRDVAGSSLTPAELRVLRLLPTHLTLSDIADALYISRNTVKTQVAAVYGKLHSTTRGEAVRAARERGLLE